MNEFTKTCLFGALTIIILASALAARVIPARSDLWFDEVWTLWLLKPITNPWQIFWKINHDNNHFLNSLWMYALGPYRSSLLYRAPSVAFGVLAVAIAGWWGRKNGRVAAIIAMLLFATSYLMIDLTTQARGYSGLIVCTLLATIWTEDALEGKNRQLHIALTILIGILFHLLMVFSAAYLTLWCYAVMLHRSHNWLMALIHTLDIFKTTIKVTFLPVFFLGLLMATGNFAIGITQPYNPHEFIQAFGRALSACAHTPKLNLTVLYIALAATLTIVNYRLFDERALFYIIAIFALPIFLFLAHAHSTNMTRYFVPYAIPFMLLCADLSGKFWSHGTSITRLVLLAILTIVVIGNTAVYIRFLREGRGHYQAALQTIVQNGATRYGSRNPKLMPFVETYYIGALNLDLHYVPWAEWCANPPSWVLVDTFDKYEQQPAQTTSFGPDACPGIYTDPKIFAYKGTSSLGLILYHRAG